MGNNKKFVVEANFIKEACKLNLTLAEFLLLIYFENADDSTFDLDKICDRLKIERGDILVAFNNLLGNGIITLTSEKGDSGKRVDKVSLEGFYEKVIESKKKEKNKKLKENIFSTFEAEFRRPLTGTEFEIIKAWLEKMYNEDLILAALKEAVYNGATNIRYIDTILYEWNKKGLKTKEDVDNYLNNRYENKKLEETGVFDYNWLDDYDK
ncbi:MAG: DnaD domain protein [Bacilli bacterium]|nr:DnaD domain protein [Bacilli bacterium]MBQ8901435.1 DnaD domain protein [Bacilli bacterium]